RHTPEIFGMLLKVIPILSQKSMIYFRNHQSSVNLFFRIKLIRATVSCYGLWLNGYDLSHHSS
ncbi:MAG: hypothetical protein ACI4C5_02825, partial [Lachnospiraceae bacterium]